MLFVAGFIMLMINPMLLIYDPGFQLSFLATLGLIQFTPFVERYLRFIPKRRLDLRGLAAATIATQIMVTPLLLYMMGTFPTYAPLTNLLILAAVPWTMLFGALATVISYVSYQLAFLFVALTYFSLEYNLFVVELFANLPFASFIVPPFRFTYVVVAYALYVAVFVIYRLFKTKTP